MDIFISNQRFIFAINWWFLSSDNKYSFICMDKLKNVYKIYKILIWQTEQQLPDAFLRPPFSLFSRSELISCIIETEHKYAIKKKLSFSECFQGYLCGHVFRHKIKPRVLSR